MESRKGTSGIHLKCIGQPYGIALKKWLHLCVGTSPKNSIGMPLIKVVFVISPVFV